MVAPLLGEPRWTLTGLPLAAVQPLELGFLLLGAIGSLVIAYRLAEEDSPKRPLRAFSPWAARVCSCAGERTTELRRSPRCVARSVSGMRL